MSPKQPSDELPAGQHSVVEINGRPYARGGGTDDTPKQQLERALTVLTTAAVCGEVDAMWAVAEVKTANGPVFVMIRYGVGSNPEALAERIDTLDTDFLAARKHADV